MVCAALLCVALGAWPVFIALDQPWLGLRLQPSAEIVSITSSRGPAAAVPSLSQLRALESGGQAVAITPVDLTPEPDVLETYPQNHDFRSRQDRIAAMLAKGPVTLQVTDEAGGTSRFEVTPQQRRPVNDLPPVFWVQVLVGSIAFIIGAWVWAMKPADWGARLFALSGLSMLFATNSAAVYSTRELALPDDLFRGLSIVNAGGACGFGIAMICLFLIYPKPLVRPRWFLLPLAVFAGGWIVWSLERAPAPTLSSAIILTEMLIILVVLGVQVWATRKDPTGRAVLLWLGLSVAVGAGAFVFSNAAPVLLGVAPAISQGYAFVFFLLIYIGLALGLRRYRLFEMGEWAFRILYYTGAALAFLALDAVLIWALNLTQTGALGLSMIAVAFLYLPLRDVLWRRTVARRQAPEHEIFEAVIETAFATSAAERSDRWTRLLVRLFDPLETAPVANPPSEPVAATDGLELIVPATADAPALALRFPWKGRGLFGPVHLQLARQLTRLMRHAEASRDAFERGAAGERRRIARDLHDDVGARLLSGLHKPDVSQTRDVLREAIADMRTIVGGLTGASLPLSKVVAELRHETGRRLEAAGIAMQWPISDAEGDETPLAYRVYKNWASAHREIVSNAIKHSGATLLTVDLVLTDDLIHLTISDDGRGLPQAVEAGNGLGNIEKRMAELGGRFEYPSVAAGLSVRLTIPLRPADNPALEPSGVHA